jgi:hypothetical protein
MQMSFGRAFVVLLFAGLVACSSDDSGGKDKDEGDAATTDATAAGDAENEAAVQDGSCLPAAVTCATSSECCSGSCGCSSSSRNPQPVCKCD